MLFQSFDLGAIRDCASLTVLASGKKISAPPRRCHGFAYFFDGHADYIYANTTLRVGPGSLLYLPMGVPYEIVRPELSHCIVFDFFAREDSAPQPPFCRTYELTALGDTFRALWRAFSVKAENHLAECKSLFYKIVSIIQQYEIGSYLPSARYLRLLPAVEYLRANFTTDDVSLATLAKIAGIAHDRGKGIVIAVNKRDAIEKDDKTIYKFTNKVRETLSFMPYAEIMFISAKTGQRIDRLFELIKYVYSQNTMRISTGKLNDILADSTARVQPPTDKGKRLRIYYMTQASTKPPTFVCFCNKAELFHFSYQRYLENQIRSTFGLEGTPVRLTIRQKGDKEG